MKTQVVCALTVVVFGLAAGGCSSQSSTPALPNSNPSPGNTVPTVLPSSTAAPSPAPVDSPPPAPNQTAKGWVEINTDPGSAPPARSDFAMTMLPDGRVLMFGGQDENGVILGDTWTFSLDELAQGSSLKAHGLLSVLQRPPLGWNPIDSDNSPRGRRASLIIGDGTIVLLSGGADLEQKFNDLYTYSGDWKQLQAANPPPPRRDHLAWIYGDGMYILGGIGNNVNGENTWLDDLWRYDFAANAWEQLSNAPGFISPSAYPAVYGDQVYLLDPHLKASSDAPTYSYDLIGGSWGTTQIEGSWPPGVRADMMWTQAGDVTYMLGGYFWDAATQSSTKTAEAWAYRPSRGWEQLMDLPFPAYGGKVVYNPRVNGLILWDGNPSQHGVLYANLPLPPAR